MYVVYVFFFFQAEDGIRDLVRSRGLGDVYKRQALNYCHYAGGDWQNLGVHTAGANVWANNPGGLNLSLIHI